MCLEKKGVLAGVTTHFFLLLCAHTHREDWNSSKCQYRIMADRIEKKRLTHLVFK